MISNLSQEIERLSPQASSDCISRVPKNLHVRNPAAYTPKVVSIGPIHHKREGLEAMEEYKLRYIKNFLDRVNISLEEYMTHVKNMEENLRGSYTDTIHLTSSEFVKIMMIDSAFVYEMLQRIHRTDERDDRIFKRPLLLTNVIEDLLLLENQIPLFILEDLFNSNSRPRPRWQTRMNIQAAFPTRQPQPEDGAESFMSLVCGFVNSRRDIGARKFDVNRVRSSNVVHLLDCLRRSHLPEHLSPPGESYFLVSEPQPGDFLRLILNCLWGCHRPSSKSVPPREADENFNLPVPVPTITELHQSGVRFTKNIDSNHLFDIKFDHRQGILKIPYFFMGDVTETVFRNLLAFEQCHHPDDLRFTDYFTLLDQPISNPSDIDLLVENGVLGNTLGDSMQAASMINDITRGLNISRAPYFDGLRRPLAGYYKKPWHKWKATLRQNYFNSPWATISVVAATVLLMLTVTQTVYAIISK